MSGKHKEVELYEQYEGSLTSMWPVAQGEGSSHATVPPISNEIPPSEVEEELNDAPGG